MSIIKETIKYKNQDTNLKINLSIGNRILGYQQEINNITEESKSDLVNPIIDNEVRRFCYDSKNIVPMELQFYFTADGSTYNPTFIESGAGFGVEDIFGENKKTLNSFFILDFYDTYESYTQTKIFTTYLTKILDGTFVPKYRIFSDTKNQFYKWNIPKSFLDKQTTSIVYGYVKFSFYNAKLGIVSLFYNKDYQTQTTPLKMYFKTKLDLDSMRWNFLLPNPAIAKAYEVPRNNAYVNRVNNTVTNFKNNKQTYPTGNTFQTEFGDYITT